MGRIVSISATAVGTVVEASIQPAGTIPADGATLLQSAQPGLFASVGTVGLKYDESKAYAAPGTSGVWNPDASNTGYYADFQTDGTQFVYTNGSYIFTSPDAVKWKPVCRVPAGLNELGVINKIKYRSGVWFALASGVVNFGYLTSVDGVVWTSVSVSTGFNDMTWDGTNYMFVGNGVSRFGTSVATLNSVATPVSVTFVEKIGTNFVSWLNSTDPNVYITSAGSVWTTQGTGQTLGFRYSIANGTLFIGRYVDATSRPIYVASSNGTTWTASGTSVADTNLFMSPTGVIWDGTAYSSGFQKNTGTAGGSVIYRFTSVSGAAASLTNAGDVYQATYSGALVAYKSGVYAFVWDYYCNTIYVTTTTPNANWALRESYAAGTAYPFWPQNQQSSLGVLGSSTTRRGMVTVGNLQSAGAATYRQSIFMEDSSGYFSPYKYDTNYWSETVNSPSCLALAIAAEGDSLFVCTTSTASTYIYTPNHTAKTLTRTALASFTLGLRGLFPARSAFVVIDGYAAGIHSIRFDGTKTSNASILGIPVAPTTVNKSSFNPANGRIMVGYQATTPYQVSMTSDGVVWTTMSVPSVFGADGVQDAALTTDYAIWHNGTEYILDRNSGVIYRGLSPSRLIEDAGLTAATLNSVATVAVVDKYRVLSSLDNNAATMLNLKSGTTTVTGSVASACAQVVAYEFGFGTLFSTIAYGSSTTPNGAINLINSPSNTHFKVPLLTADDISNSKFITI